MNPKVGPRVRTKIMQDWQQASNYPRLNLWMLRSQEMSKFLPSPLLVNKAASIFVSLAFGPHSCASTVNVTVGGWPSGSTVCFTPMLFPDVLNAKQGNSMYQFQVLV